MKRFSVAAAALAIAIAVLAAEPPKAGQAAPEFRLLDQNDHIVRLSAARGHKVVLVFYRGYW